MNEECLLLKALILTSSLPQSTIKHQNLAQILVVVVEGLQEKSDLNKLTKLMVYRLYISNHFILLITFQWLTTEAG